MMRGIHVADKFDTNTYLYLVLVPVAEVFRKELNEKKRPFHARRNFKQCRIEFVDKAVEKQWQQFCVANDLKNDVTLKF